MNMEVDWTVLGVLIGLAASAIIVVACLCIWALCSDDFYSTHCKSRKSKMRFKRGHRTKFHHGVSSHSGDVEYCEDDVCGINIEIEDD